METSELIRLNQKVQLLFNKEEDVVQLINVMKFLIQGMSNLPITSDLTITEIVQMFNLDDAGIDMTEYHKNLQLLGKFYPTLTRNAAEYYNNYMWSHEKGTVKEHLTSALRAEKNANIEEAFKQYYYFLLHYRQTGLFPKPCQLFVVWSLIRDRAAINCEYSLLSIMISIVATQIKIWIVQPHDDAFILYATKMLIPRGYLHIKEQAVFANINKQKQLTLILRKICHRHPEIPRLSLERTTEFHLKDIGDLNSFSLPYMSKVIDVCKTTPWVDTFSEFDEDFYMSTAFFCFYAVKPRLMVLLQFYKNRLNDLVQQINKVAGGRDDSIKPMVAVLFDGVAKFMSVSITTNVLNEYTERAILTKMQFL